MQSARSLRAEAAAAAMQHRAAAAWQHLTAGDTDAQVAAARPAAKGKEPSPTPPTRGLCGHLRLLTHSGGNSSPAAFSAHV